MTALAKDKLGSISCMSLIINKMIGTGIFLIPATIFGYTNGNVALLLLLFVLGSIIILCGLIIYLEFALNLPFRNGGEKNYLLRVFNKPKGLMGCVYAFQIVILGFSSGNSYAFGKYVLFALRGNEDQNENIVKFIGVLCITFCTILHYKYPKHGKFLFNFLGIFKVFIFVLIIFIGLMVALGMVNLEANYGNFKNMWLFENNEKPSTYSLAIALLEVIYSFKGWENANYVLNEVSDPYHILTFAAPLAVIFCSILYILVLLSYLIVIPKDEFSSSGVLIAGIFFNKVFGESLTARILPIMISMSNLGNVMVVSYAHSHVNKELADSNYLPFSDIFGNFNYSLILHWFITVVVLVLPPSTEIYEFVVNLYIYPGTWINIFITLGLVYLKINSKSEKWGEFNDINLNNLNDYGTENSPLLQDNAPRKDLHQIESSIVKSKSRNIKRISAPYIAIFIFFFANLFLALFPFVPPPPNSLAANSIIPYWCFPIIGISVLSSGAIFYYLRKYHRLWSFNKHGIGSSEIKYENE